MAVRICKATPADALLLAQTRRIVWEQTYRGIYPDKMLDEYDIHHYEQRDRERMSQPGQYYYLFLDEELCVGYFSFGPYHYGTYRDFSLCLNNLYILDGYKGKGLGRQAFSMLTQYCREQQIHKFFCGCNANNLPAIAFYRHMGGVQGDETSVMLPKEDQIIHFEFYLGEKI